MTLSYSRVWIILGNWKTKFFIQASDKSKWGRKAERQIIAVRIAANWRWNPRLVEFGYKNGFIGLNENQTHGAFNTRHYLNAPMKECRRRILYQKIKNKSMSSVHLIENAVFLTITRKKIWLNFGLKEIVRCILTP